MLVGVNLYVFKQNELNSNQIRTLQRLVLIYINSKEASFGKKFYEGV